jgi:hypothetical protein
VRLVAQVEGGGMTEVQVTPQPAGTLTVHLRTPGGQDPEGSQVWLDEVRRDPLQADDDDDETVSTLLAGGCYRVRAELEGFADAEGRACVEAGGATQVELTFPPPDMRDGREGCRKSGCLNGLSCRSDGSCQ